LLLLFSFALQYAIRRVKDGLKLNGTHQFLVYADDDNILGRSVHTVKKNTEALGFWWGNLRETTWKTQA
jgi:hypothetical protein